jgi:hypothetical protein
MTMIDMARRPKQSDVAQSILFVVSVAIAICLFSVPYIMIAMHAYAKMNSHSLYLN